MSEEPPTIAIAYDRVSTIRQAKEGLMLDIRDEQIRRFAEYERLEILDGIIHSDRGVSAWSGKKRPAFKEAVQLACHPGRVLLVVHTNRAFRNLKEAVETKEKLIKAGASLVSIEQKMDIRTATGALMFNMLASIAEYESTNKSECARHLHASIRKARCSREWPEGYTTAGHQPYGWKIVGGKGSQYRVRVTHEQAYIRRVLCLLRKMELQEMRQMDIRARLNELGMLSPRENRKLPPGPWTEGNWNVRIPVWKSYWPSLTDKRIEAIKAAKQARIVARREKRAAAAARYAAYHAKKAAELPLLVPPHLAALAEG